jgi:hypothetical protein
MKNQADFNEFAVFDTHLVPVVKEQKQNAQILKAKEKRLKQNARRLKNWTGK